METIGEILCWTLREPSEAIVPEIMVIMEAIDFANSLHEFGSKIMETIGKTKK